MKYNWEEKDLKCGRYVCVESWPENSEDISGLCSVTYKIGYIVGSTRCMCLIAITDGMIISYKQHEDTRNAKEKMLESFNTDDHGYRPLNQEQVMRRMEYLKHMNEGDH